MAVESVVGSCAMKGLNTRACLQAKQIAVRCLLGRSRTSVQPLLLKPQECLIGGLDLEFKASSVTCSGQCSKVHVWGWGKGRVTLDGITPYYRRRSCIPGHINVAGPGLTKKGELYLFPVLQVPLLV